MPHGSAFVNLRYHKISGPDSLWGTSLIYVLGSFLLSRIITHSDKEHLIFPLPSANSQTIDSRGLLFDSEKGFSFRIHDHGSNRAPGSGKLL
jgi:hypothetical protein